MHHGDLSKVFLAGFSQGALISIFASITIKDGLLGGVFAHSGAIFPYLQTILRDATASQIESFKIEDKKLKLPILHYHGRADPLFKPEPLMQMIDAFWNQLLGY